MSDIKDREDSDVLDAIRAREIVKEIMNFGVSESQVLKIIQFLSYELEDRAMMIKIKNVFSVEDIVNKKPDNTI